MLNYVLIFLGMIILSSSFCFAQDMQIVDDWYYINGEKFFIKGIGYETHTRPGQVPWRYSFDADLIKFDLNRIKNAGFNTIRTWSALREEELQIVEESGLKILFGIWIAPDGDFSDKSFISESYNHVNDVLNYSANYNSIIGYLIMNEPQVQHIYDVGAQSLSDLWRSIVDLIHRKHPGIPVSFSNTMIGDYINMQTFDFAAYNAYIYNPVTISKSHGYAGYLHYLKQNRAPQMPFIITEYGLSVSPGTPNDGYGYGGNSLEQQTSGDLLMYRELLDAGVQGNCVFQYHDGWWKAGNEYSHDTDPEEWFGLIEFSGPEDKYGTTRPVWAAYEKYNKAIITNPKNGHIYQNTIPLEFFLTEDVSSYQILMSDSLLFSESFNKTYYTHELNLTLNENIKDIVLDFYFLDSNRDTLKSESISVLYTKNNLELPKLNIEIIPENLIAGGRNYLKMQVTKDSLFTFGDNKIDYVLHSHIGFENGTAKSYIMDFSNNSWSHVDYFDIRGETKVATFGAGFNIIYGGFKKRIFNQKILLSGNWAYPIAAPELVTEIMPFNRDSVENQPMVRLFRNYPNPFNAGTTIKYSIPSIVNSHWSFVQLKVYNTLGENVATLVNEAKAPGNYSVEFEASKLPSGVYFYKLTSGKFTSVRKMLLLK